MTPPDHTQTEAATREEVDRKLIQAGWAIQDRKSLNLYESLGVAVPEHQKGCVLFNELPRTPCVLDAGLNWHGAKRQ